MSNNVNTDLIERAMELSEECTNSALGGQLDYAIKHKDMDHLYTLVKMAEQHLTYIETINDSEVF